MIAGVRDDAALNRPALCLLEFTDRPQSRPKNSSRPHQSHRTRSNHAGEYRRLNHTGHRSARRRPNASSPTTSPKRSNSDFDLPLLTPGTDFQRAVWNHLLTIPARHNHNLRHDSPKHSEQSKRPTRRRSRQRSQSNRNRHPMPPRHRLERQPPRLRRRPPAKTRTARTRTSQLVHHCCRLEDQLQLRPQHNLAVFTRRVLQQRT